MSGSDPAGTGSRPSARRELTVAVLHQGRAYVQAGAGIVADSDAATEEAETRHKARAVLSAIATAEGMREVR